jgi:hypothetical protein
MALIFFSCAWVIGIYLFNSALIRRLSKIDIRTALCYISSVIVLGVFGEVLVDSVYDKIFGVPLWVYRLLPIHHSYTSYYSLFIWGMYGFHLYLLHSSFGRKIRSTWVLAIIISVEALIIEVLFNLTSLTFLGQYIFYYLPNDLWHVTSIQVMPVYFLAGFLIARLTKDERIDPWFFILTNLCLASVLIFLAS